MGSIYRTIVELYASSAFRDMKFHLLSLGMMTKTFAHNAVFRIKLPSTVSAGQQQLAFSSLDRIMRYGRVSMFPDICSEALEHDCCGLVGFR